MCIRDSLFNTHNINLQAQHSETLDNRYRFIELLIGEDMRVLNTFFPKADDSLFTFKEMGCDGTAPYERGRFETLDYIIAQQRWRN
eukprot:4733758-Prorocentrum_lima.AAC.1